MYGTDGDDLIAIDADTADITYLYGIGSTAALAALPDGRLVSAGLDGVFFIEPETGEKTLVAASSGYGLDGDVAVFPDGSVYWSASTPEGGYALLRVAPESAVATLIGPLDTDRAWGLLSVDERLVAVSGTGVVYEIDPTTAGSVMLAELPGYWVGAASKP